MGGAGEWAATYNRRKWPSTTYLMEMRTQQTHALRSYL